MFIYFFYRQSDFSGLSFDTLCSFLLAEIGHFSGQLLVQALL